MRFLQKRSLLCVFAQMHKSLMLISNAKWSIDQETKLIRFLESHGAWPMLAQFLYPAFVSRADPAHEGYKGKYLLVYHIPGLLSYYDEIFLLIQNDSTMPLPEVFSDIFPAFIYPNFLSTLSNPSCMFVHDLQDHVSN